MRASDQRVGDTMSEQTSGKPAESPYRGSIYSGPKGFVSAELAEAIQEAEKAFGCPVWALIHRKASEDDDYGDIGQNVYREFFSRRAELGRRTDGVALILDSRGGYAHDAYRIAALLRHATAPAAVRILVPNKAKSAGTLLALGASELYMGQEAELGPLDVQIGEDALDPKHSALNEVQALERLRSVAIGQVIVY